MASKEEHPLANVTELIEENEKKCDILSGNKDRLLTLDVHSTSVPIGRCFPHTLQFKGEKSSWRILLQAR